MNPTMRVALVHSGPGSDLPPRLAPMADALQAVGLRPEPIRYLDEDRERVAVRLAGMAGALVWVDPLAEDGADAPRPDGQAAAGPTDRAGLDEVLRGAAAGGVWLGTHPDVIDRLGTKDVLVTTCHLGWGSDTYRYDTLDQLAHDFPARLARHRVRVLKADRGNGGRTVWKVRLTDGHQTDVPVPGDAEILVQHARDRQGAVETTTVGRLLHDLAPVFDGWHGTGHLVDQEFVPGVTQGLVRCYLVGGDVVGFARQYPPDVQPTGPLAVDAATLPSPDAVMGLPSGKTMYGSQEPAFADLRARLETEWVPAAARDLHVRPDELPALWDIDLLVSDSPSDVAARFVLCEINASSVIPFPDEAPRRVARRTLAALQSR